MEPFEHEIQLCRTLYYAANLPVRLAAGEKMLFSMPERIVTAADVTGDASLSAEVLLTGFEQSSAYGASSPADYASTAAGEKYIVLHIAKGLTVSVGPFLAEEATPEYTAGLVRSGVIKLRSRAAVQEYLSSLPVLSSRQFYYLGKLLGMLFCQKSAGGEAEFPAAAESRPDAPGGDSPGAPIPDSYFIKSQDYRARLFLHSPYMVEQEICHFISAGDTDGALHVLSEINSKPRAQLAKNTIRSLKNSMICSCAFMARAAISGGVSPDEAFTLSDAYIQEIEASADIRRIISYETEMVKGYTAAVKASAGLGQSKAVSQTVAYINSHLCEELTTESIADAVFLNPNYLSGLFAKETGETVHRFIIRRRVEEAEFFVRNTSESFADIASFYRFCSQSHFTKCFREIMGITPGKCRNGKA